MTRQEIGWRGQRAVRLWLGRKLQKIVKPMRYRCPWDMEVNGWKIEVKTATFRNGHWLCNIHHHGVMNEAADFYVIRLESCPFWKDTLHLVIKAPLNRSTLWISPRSLLVKWSAAVEASRLLKPKEKTDSD